MTQTKVMIDRPTPDVLAIARATASVMRTGGILRLMAGCKIKESVDFVKVVYEDREQGRH